MELENTKFYDDIVELVNSAKKEIKQVIDTTIAHTYFEIGRRIVEEEQNGKERAEYGKEIIKNLSELLTDEFGKGFSLTNIRQMRSFYITYGKQQTVSEDLKLKLSWSHYLFLIYNRFLKSFVLIDLKIGELQHQDIGQMQMYVNYYDREIIMEDENKTIGLILCKDKSDMVVKYTLPEENTQIFASKYQTVLPSKEDLKKLIEE